MKQWELVEIYGMYEDRPDILSVYSSSPEDLKIIENYFLETYPKLKDGRNTLKSTYTIRFEFYHLWHSKKFSHKTQPYYLDVVYDLIKFLRNLSYYPFQIVPPRKGFEFYYPLYYCFIKHPIEE